MMDSNWGLKESKGGGGVYRKQRENKGWLYQQRNVFPADIM